MLNLKNPFQSASIKEEVAASPKSQFTRSMALKPKMLYIDIPHNSTMKKSQVVAAGSELPLIPVDKPKAEK